MNAVFGNLTKARHCIMQMSKKSYSLPRTAKAHFSTTMSTMTVKSTPQEQSEVTINFVNRKGEKTTVKAAVDDTLLDVAVDNELDIESYGVCEGTLACSTCHVVLDKPIYEVLDEKCPPTFEEMDMLDLACGLTETSRLGCQVEICGEMDGCTVRVPEESTDAREL